MTLGRLRSGDVFLLAGAISLPTTKPPTDGLIGVDILDTADVDYDVLGGKLSFYRPAGRCASPPVAMDGDLYQADMLTDRPNEHRPYVTAMIGRTPL